MLSLSLFEIHFHLSSANFTKKIWIFHSSRLLSVHHVHLSSRTAYAQVKHWSLLMQELFWFATLLLAPLLDYMEMANWSFVCWFCRLLDNNSITGTLDIGSIFNNIASIQQYKNKTLQLVSMRNNKITNVTSNFSGRIAYLGSLITFE